MAFLDRIRRRLTTGQRRREDEREARQPTISAPTPESTPTQRTLRAVESGISQLPGGKIAAGIAKRITGTGRPEAPLGEPFLEPEIETKPQTVKGLKEDISNIGFRIDFNNEAKLSLDNPNAKITFTSKATGDRTVLTGTEYKAISKGKGGTSEGLTPKALELQHRRNLASAVASHLIAQMEDVTLAEGLRAQFAKEIRSLEADPELTIDEAEQLFRELGMPMPPQLFGDLSITNVPAIGTAAATAGSLAAIGLKGAEVGGRLGGAGGAAIGALTLLSATFGAMYINKNRNIKFADRARTRVESDITKIREEIGSGSGNPHQQIQRINKQKQILAAALTIAKEEQDDALGLGSVLTDVDEKIVEMRMLQMSIEGLEKDVVRLLTFPTAGRPAAPVPA